MTVTSAQYMRAYRARHGGSSPSDKATRRASSAAASWVRHHHPEVWRQLLADQRLELGLPIEVGPGGNFTKPISHGTYGGYEAHRSRGQEPCDECREAQRAYNR